MTNIHVELAAIELPDFGQPTVEPHLEATEYEARLKALRERMEDRGLSALIVYADREHVANLAYLIGYDPRFEEALLILTRDRPPLLLVGNEGLSYAKISPVELEPLLYQPFSLMGQDRSKTKPLDEILREAGLGSRSNIGLVDWKYFGTEVGQQPELWLNAPAYLVDALRSITGKTPVNVTGWLMNPRDGLRTTNGVDQLAVFEFAATSISNAMRRVLWSLRPGLREFEAMAQARLNGLPLSCHPMLSTGPRVALGLASPSNRRMERGEPFICALGVWGALNARAGFLVQAEKELPANIRDYLERLVKPYFAAIVEWYQHVGIGVSGGELYDLIQRHLGDPFFGVTLNPGHLIHLDEWVHSPIYAGSDIELRSGMALQVDVIPATHSPYFTTNIEDGIALADEALRREFAGRWPEAWSRIQARRTFMQEQLGIQLKAEVLPFSNLATFLPPYLLDPGKGMRVAR